MDRDDVLQIVKTNMEFIIGDIDGDKVSEAQSMKDYGADSLEMVEIVSRTMKEMKVKVRRTDLASISTISELADLLYQAQTCQDE